MVSQSAVSRDKRRPDEKEFSVACILTFQHAMRRAKRDCVAPVRWATKARMGTTHWPSCRVRPKEAAYPWRRARALQVLCRSAAVRSRWRVEVASTRREKHDVAIGNRYWRCSHCRHENKRCRTRKDSTVGTRKPSSFFNIKVPLQAV